MKIILKIFILMAPLLFVINSPLHAQLNATPIVSKFLGDRGNQDCEEEWEIIEFYDAVCPDDVIVTVDECEPPVEYDPCTHVCFTITVSGSYSNYTVAATEGVCPYPLPWANGYVATFCVGPDACIDQNLPTTAPIEINVTPIITGNKVGCVSTSTCSVMIGD